MNGTLDCLLVVAHPDDDAIFAGELQRRLTKARWTVVCLTYDAASPRGRELISWQTALGTDPRRIHFLAQPDPPQDWPCRRNSIDQASAETALRAHSLTPTLVVTHNRRGEYGHPHHRLTHQLVAALFPTTPRLCFAMGLAHPDLAIPCPTKHQRALQHFASQAEAIHRVARAAETFHWEIPPPTAPTRPTAFDHLARLAK